MRVKQYPHFLFIEEATDSIQDENGNWTESIQSRKLISTCRSESDGKGAQLQVGGGDFSHVTATIFCPKSCPVVPNGTKIYVADDPECANVRITGICLNFDKTQLHSRLWV